MGVPEAYALWGRDAVEEALSFEDPEPISPDLIDAVKRKLYPEGPDLGGLSGWALSLPWRRFCAVVRLFSGQAKEDLLASE